MEERAPKRGAAVEEEEESEDYTGDEGEDDASTADSEEGSEATESEEASEGSDEEAPLVREEEEQQQQQLRRGARNHDRSRTAGRKPSPRRSPRKGRRGANKHKHTHEDEDEDQDQPDDEDDDDDDGNVAGHRFGGSARGRPRGRGRSSDDALTRVLLWNRGLSALLQWAFIRWSRLLHKYPVVIMLLSAVIYGGLGFGLFLEDQQDDQPRLWLDDGSAYVTNEDYQKQVFGEHEELFIITAKRSGADLLSPDKQAISVNESRTYLEEMYRLHAMMFNVSVEWKNRTYTLTDLCVHPNPAKPHVCRYYSVLDYWGFNLTAIQTDPDPHVIVGGPPQQTSFRQPLLRNLVVGGMTLTGVNGSLERASAFKSLVYVRASQAATDANPDWPAIVAAWEDALVSNTTQFSQESPLIGVYLVLQASLTDKLIAQMVGDDWLFFLSLGCMFVFLIGTLYSFDCVISKVLLTVAGIVHVVLAGVAATGLNGFLRITITPLSQTLYFLVMALGINHILLLVHAYERTLIEDLTTSPGLNPFRKVKARDANPELVRHLGNKSNQDVVVVDDEYWINGAMAKACPTITIECLIEVIAFLAISISPVPGLRSFGQQAALAVGTEYLLLISFFACCLILDSRRIMKYRSDILPCISCYPDVDDVDQITSTRSAQSVTSEDEKEQHAQKGSGGSDLETMEGLSENRPTTSIQYSPGEAALPAEEEEASGQVIMIRERPGAANRKRGTILVPLMSRYLAPFLLWTPVRVILLACLLGFAGLGIYGMDKWEQNFLPSELYSSNSPEYEYFKLDEKLFPDGSNPIQVITTRSNFSSPQIGERLLHLEADVLNSTWIDGRSFHSWYSEMVRYLQSVPAYNATLVGGIYPPPARFYAYLTAFLNSSRGEFFHGDVLLSHATQTVTAARFLPLSFNLIELSDQIDAIEDLYAITNEVQPLDAFPFDPNWSFFMTFPAIQASSHIYLILAFASVFIVTFVLMDAVSCFIVLVNFVCVHLELMGIVMHFSSPTIPISQLSLATIVITTALSVTYSVHILQHFVHGGEDITDRKQRIIHALSTTGYTLTCGFFCVVLGCLVAFFVHSAIFLTFVHLFAITLALSWGNTILLVPILMSFLSVW